MFLFLLLNFLFFCVCGGLFRAAPMAYGGSQARGPIGAAAAGVCHNHSRAGSLIHWARPGMEPASLWIWVGLVTAEPYQEPRFHFFSISLSTTCHLPIFLVLLLLLTIVPFFSCRPQYHAFYWHYLFFNLSIEIGLHLVLLNQLIL